MLIVMEVDQDPVKGVGFHLEPTCIQLEPDTVTDLPVSLYVYQKDDLVFLMAKISHLYVFNIHTRDTLYTAKITAVVVFVTCIQEFTGSMFGITVT